MAEKQQKLIKNVVDEEPREATVEEAGPTAEKQVQTFGSVNADAPPWADANTSRAMPPAPVEDPIYRLAERGVSMEQLEKLIAMRDRERDYQSQREFSLHFAEMQHAFSALGPAPRPKDVDGKYRYAPINTLVKHYGPTIGEHGFGFRFYERTLEDGRLEVFMDISGYGHVVTNSKVLPVYEPDKATQSGKPIMNVLQAEGVRSTYGQRYIFVAGFGLVSESEDTDGLGFNEGVKYADYIHSLQAENDLESLRKMGKEFHDKLKAEKDHDGARVIYAVYTKCKEALERKGANDAGV